MTARHVIAIDALAARFGGTAYAALQIVSTLLARDDVERVVVVCRPNSLVHRGLERTRGLTAVTVEPPPRAEVPLRVAWEAVRLPRLLVRHQATGLLSMSGMLPVAPGVPFVGLQANPTPYEGRDGVRKSLRRRAVRRTATAARATYVPSAHVAALVGDVARKRVVALGVDRARFAPIEPPGTELLCVGDFYPHKHHDLLLDAYGLLAQPRPPLRLVGNPDVDEDNFARIKRKADGIPGVQVEGRVDFPVLVEAYQRARAMLIASDRESFSMPVVEALASGVPVIARDYPTLRETAGGGALYVRGDDPREWAKAIEQVVADSRVHAALRRQGLIHVERYSWDAFARQLCSDLGGPS